MCALLVGHTAGCTRGQRHTQVLGAHVGCSLAGGKNKKEPRNRFSHVTRYFRKMSVVNEFFEQMKNDKGSHSFARHWHAVPFKEFVQHKDAAEPLLVPLPDLIVPENLEKWREHFEHVKLTFP